MKRTVPIVYNERDDLMARSQACGFNLFAYILSKHFKIISYQINHSNAARLFMRRWHGFVWKWGTPLPWIIINYDHMIIWSYFLHSNVIFGFVCFGLEITRQTEVSNHQHPLSHTLLGTPFKPWHVVEPTWCNVREFVDSCSPAKSSSNLVGLNMGITLW